MDFMKVCIRIFSFYTASLIRTTEAISVSQVLRISETTSQR